MVLIKNIYKGLRTNPVSVFQEKGSFLGQKNPRFSRKRGVFLLKNSSLPPSLPLLSPSLSLSPSLFLSLSPSLPTYLIDVCLSD